MKFILTLGTLVFASLAGAAPAAYDPLALPDTGTKSLDLVAGDAKRSLPLLVVLPKAAGPAPVILFSHGLGGSNKACSYLGEQWAGRGYVVVFVQHPGSDESILKGSEDPMRAMRKAATTKNLVLRIEDIHTVLDQLGAWNSQPSHPLNDRLDLEKIGMAGHSFGALTTQAVSGQTFPWVGTKFTDPRIKSALCLSPSVPAKGSAIKAFESVKIPWMLMTGTNDIAILGPQDISARLGVFPALPPGGKYEVVLNGAEHLAFTDRTVAGTRRNPLHHKSIRALSTGFWDVFLKGDPAAKAWLDGEAPKYVLSPADTFQKK